MIGCFVVFGVSGYAFAPKRTLESIKSTSTRILSSLSGKNIDVDVGNVNATESGNTEVLSDVKADGVVNIKTKDINIK